MGSFFLTSKKASATLVFLVISIIIVSSGVIIVHEVEKSNNENNIAGTGLVLLGNEQNNLDALLDSSDSEIKLFTFGDSERKSSSKESSGGGGSTDSQTYNEPEILDNDEIIDDQTSKNQTETNYTEEINESDFSDGQIFEQNGTTYIMRDSAAYVLASSSQISFSPSLPLSICVLPSGVGEKIDIKLLGSLSPSLNLNGAFACIYADYVGAEIELKIMEDDIVWDDLIASKTFHVSVSCDNPKVDYSKVFENVDLSSQFEGWGSADYSKIEVYGLVKLTSNNFHNIEYSTLTYGVDKANCDCLSGSCCDLSSRPYEFKPYGSSCGTCKACDSSGHCSKTPSDDSACGIMDCSNWYVKTGTQSPTTNQWCYNKKDITSNRCEAFGNCKDSNTADCGSQSNDQLKYYCGVCKFIRTGDCTGTTKGSCSNYYKHVSCGTNKECDGSGTCVTCTSHSYTSCWDNDVYYYDACDNREEKKLPDCGNSFCDSWGLNFCKDGNVYHGRLCYNKGCLNAMCFNNPYGEEEFVQDCGGVGCSNGKCNFECVENSDCGMNDWIGNPYCKYNDVWQYYRYYKCEDPETPQSTCTHKDTEFKKEVCQYGCSNGECVPPSACHDDAMCGDDGPIGDPWCSNDDVWQEYINWTCHYPGELDAYCSNYTSSQILEDCPEDSYSDNYCSDDDVYVNFTDRGCLDRACFENTTPQFVQECGEWGCSDGECLYVECYNDTMCGPEDDYVGNPFCQGGDVWQNYINYTCNYAGTGNSYCSNSTALELKENCGSDYCEDWGSNYCMLDDVYHEKTCHDKGCSGGICFDNTYTEEEKVEECGISEYTGDNYCYSDNVYRDYITRECSYSRCTSSISERKIEDCEHGCISGRCKIEICNYGGCYYF